MIKLFTVLLPFDENSLFQIELHQPVQIFKNKKDTIYTLKNDRIIKQSRKVPEKLNTKNKQLDKISSKNEGENMDISLIVIVTNTLVVLATFIATLYRIKIEREQIQTFKKNAHAKDALESLRKYIQSERDCIKKLDEKELNDFFDYLEKLGEN